MNKIMNYMLKYRRFIMIILDILVVLFSSFCVTLIFTNMFSNAMYVNMFIKTAILQIIIYLTIFIVFNLYDRLWRCANIKDIFICFLAALIAGVIYNVYLNKQYNFVEMDYSILNIIIPTMFLCIYRIIYKFMRRFIFSLDKYNNKNSVNGEALNTLVIGSEKHIDKLSLHLMMIDNDMYNICRIIINNKKFDGTMINGIKVLGDIEKIDDVCKKDKISAILVSDKILSYSHYVEKLNTILKQNDIKLFKFSTLENINNLHSKSIKINKLNIEDLLGRDVIHIGVGDNRFIKDKTILVTGGGGSIGSELCRQISTYHPKKLIILDIYENNAYEIEQELLRKYGDELDVNVEIASVRDSDKLDKLFSEYCPEVVLHAAAHKHVPLMEHNPEEAIKNNVFGTFNVAQMADKYHAEKFVLISTDKAVNPTNIMGASKRITEMIIQYFSIFSCTSFSAVRFGNVLGSNGSVIPLFKKQIEDGGPVTVTHPEIVRYFMTISEAVDLVLQAGELAKGGEIFVLDMGEPVKIKDLAENMIKLSGVTVGKDIEIVYTGLRPGEKLYEEMLMDEEGLDKTSNDRIFIGKSVEIDMNRFIENLEIIKELAETNDSEKIFKFMSTIVNTYKNNNQVNLILNKK